MTRAGRLRRLAADDGQLFAGDGLLARRHGGVHPGLGMGLVFMPLNALAFATLDGKYRTDGASILNLMRSIGQSAGISMVTVLLAQHPDQPRRSCRQYHRQDDPGTQPRPDRPVRQLFRRGARCGERDGEPAGGDDRLYRRFLPDGWISIAVVPLVLLLKKPRGKVEIVHSE
ncbi:hypothetical protein AB5I41_25425 [Sphingomonas sp. MMS24-JH45]